MEKKIFNFKYYEPAIKELWEKRVPDIKIANIIGVSNSLISKYRKSFKLSAVVSNTKTNMSDEDIIKVFVKHNCCDFSEAVKYGGSSTTLLAKRESVNNLSGRKLTAADFFNPNSFELALENFIYYNLYAPQSRVIQYLDELFIRYHKKPLLKESFKSLYSKALQRYKSVYGFNYRFAEPVFEGDKLISELFVVYLIIYFATKARNKVCNPKFISKYCEFIYNVGPIKQSYLVELYAVLGIAIIDDDFVPSDDMFKEERALIETKESTMFVPFPYMFSDTDSFALPFWAAKKYEAWLSAQLSKKVSVPGIIKSEPKVAETPFIDTSEEVVTDNNEVCDVKSNNEVSEVLYTIDNLPSSVGTLVVGEMSSDEKRGIYFKALVDAAVGFVSTEDYYLAASLLQIIHAEKHNKKYTVDLKEGD